MSLHRLTDINNLTDPLKQYQCKFTISAGGMAAWFGDKGLIGKGIVGKKDFELRCTSFSLPGTTINTVETFIGNHHRKRPTIQDKSGEWDVSVVEDQNANVLQALWDWCDLISNPFTGLSVPSALYLGRAAVEIGGNIKQHGHKTIYLRGLYPVKIAQTKIDTSSSAPVVINVTFHYDWYSENGTTLL